MNGYTDYIFCSSNAAFTMSEMRKFYLNCCLDQLFLVLTHMEIALSFILLLQLVKLQWIKASILCHISRKLSVGTVTSSNCKFLAKSVFLCPAFQIIHLAIIQNIPVLIFKGSCALFQWNNCFFIILYIPSNMK